MRWWIWLSVAAALGGCARSATTTPQASAPTYTPLPVPQPVIERKLLGAELQELWLRIERAVDMRPPEPPQDSSKEAIEAWANEAFRPWLMQRQQATDYALSATFGLRTSPDYEKGIGTTLFAYMYEDLASGIRGAPVPTPIADDPELLAIYEGELDKHLRPYAELSARGYYVCLATFLKLNDMRWFEWAEFCETRGAEISENFKLVPPEPKTKPVENPVPALTTDKSPPAGDAGGDDAQAADAGPTDGVVVSEPVDEDDTL